VANVIYTLRVYVLLDKRGEGAINRLTLFLGPLSRVPANHSRMASLHSAGKSIAMPTLKRLIR